MTRNRRACPTEVISGDGIGKEVIPQWLRRVDAKEADDIGTVAAHVAGFRQ